MPIVEFCPTLVPRSERISKMKWLSALLNITSMTRKMESPVRRDGIEVRNRIKG